MTLGGPLALADQVETQACTPEQNRICACRPGWYCTFRRQEGCRLCAPQRKCLPGFGVAKPGKGLEPVVPRDPLGPLLRGYQPTSSAWECQPLPTLSPFVLSSSRLGSYCVLVLGVPEMN